MRSMLIWILAVGWVLPVEAAVTVDPDAIPAAQQLLAYFKSLSSRPDHKLVSGQMVWVDMVNRNGLDYAVLDQILANTGQYPGLIGMLEPCQDEACSPEPAASSSLIVDHWNHGGIIMSHILIAQLPWTWYNMSGPLTDDQITALMADPRYLSFLQKEADRYLWYQNQGVVFLARPFLENNGYWMWFGGCSDAKFHELWIHFQNFMMSHGVHNLLYVFAVTSEAGNYNGRYPGDAYVDMAGLDYYEELGSAPLVKIGGYDELAATGKPIVLAEYGDFTNDGTLSYQSRDYRNFLQGIKQNMPQIVYWMAWSPPWDLASQGHMSEVLNDPWVQNRPLPFNSSTPPLPDVIRPAAPKGVSVT